MKLNFRRQGVYGEDAPTRKERVVNPADFAIGGIQGLFEYAYNKAFQVENPEEARIIFGEDVLASRYAPQEVKLFYRNALRGKLVIVSSPGNDGSAIDAVVSNATINNQGPNPEIVAYAAYKGAKRYGSAGDRTGYALLNGSRFSTKLADVAAATDTSIKLESVIGMVVGDAIKIALTGNGGATVEKKITLIDESAKTVHFSGALHATATGVVGDAVTVPGVRIRTYQKSINGIESEIEKEKGEIFCSMESDVTEFYYQNVHESNIALLLEDQGSAETLLSKLPSDTTSVQYLSGGSNGTAHSTLAHWQFSMNYFKGFKPRIIVNPDTDLVSVHKALWSYSSTRVETDFPGIMARVQKDLDIDALEDLGNGYQTSDRNFSMLHATWLGVDNPFGGANAPDRIVPGLGAKMGAWIRTINTLGIHHSAAVRAIPLYGVNSVYQHDDFDDDQRTRLLNARVNICQSVPGGIIMRNNVTISVEPEFTFAEGLILSNYLRESAKESLGDSENTPTSFNRLASDRAAIVKFGNDLWKTGSTGDVALGETFGQQEVLDENGNITGTTKFEDHFDVVADPRNNTKANLSAGERNVDIYNSFATPAGSIRIRTGFQL